MFNKSGGKEEVFIFQFKIRLKYFLALEHVFQLLLAEQAEFIEHFQCHELGENRIMIPSHIAITRTHMHVLREIESKVCPRCTAGRISRNKRFLFLKA